MTNSNFKALLVHHDFYYESERYRQPSLDFVRRVLEANYPPREPWAKHCAINTLTQQELQRRWGLQADILYDVVDVSKAVGVDDYNQDMLLRYGVGSGDIKILQPTRVVQRKQIELAVDLVRLLDQPQFRNRLSQGLYDGRSFDPVNGKVALIVSGYAEKRDEPYLANLLAYARGSGVNLLHIANDVAVNRQNGSDAKRYSLMDTYPHADFVTYPSWCEGGANNLLEAMISGKPAAAFTNPLLTADFLPQGFRLVNLGNTVACNDGTGLVRAPESVTFEAATQVAEILTNRELYREIAATNYHLVKARHSHENAGRVLLRNLA